MKVTIDVDMTPEELRKLFGLPDVAGFNQQLIDDMQARMSAGMEGYDPARIFSSYMKGSMASWDMFQKMLTNMAAAGGGWPKAVDPSDASGNRNPSGTG